MKQGVVVATDRRWLPRLPLRVVRAAVLSWVRDGKLTPTLTTPGGHHRFDLDDVQRQLREQRQRGGDN